MANIERVLMQKLDRAARESFQKGFEHASIEARPTTVVHKKHRWEANALHRAQQKNLRNNPSGFLDIWGNPIQN